MSDEGKRWERINELYHAVRKREKGERATFLDQVCRGDKELRREVESLLAADEQAGEFLAAPALEVAAQRMAGDRARSLIGQEVGHYQIVSLLGEGGMGEVYLAEDTSLDRKVALKFLPQSLALDEVAHQRFIREAKSAAALDHPYICKVYEVGEAEGRTFIAMEYLKGRL